MCRADGLLASFRQPEVPDLTFFDQIPHRARDLLHGGLRIDTVLVEEINVVGPEPLQRLLRHLADTLGSTVDPQGWLSLDEAELRRNHHLISDWRQRLPNNRLIGEQTIGLSG